MSSWITNFLALLDKSHYFFLSKTYRPVADGGGSSPSQKAQTDLCLKLKFKKAMAMFGTYLIHRNKLDSSFVEKSVKGEFLLVCMDY